MTRSAAFAFLVSSSLALAACGGDGNSGGAAQPPPVSGTVSGSAVKGPVGGASVTAYGINAGALGPRIATATTDAQGNFSLSMGTYSGPVLLQMSGGSYLDEASGSTMPMMAGDVMTAVISSMSAGSTVSGIQMTPLTSMAQAAAQHLAGGMTDANITAANAAVGTYFRVNDILHTVPMNPTVPNSGGAATQDMMNYGISIAAMARSAQNQGMSSSSAMVTAMMNDASDGMMNGRMGTDAVMMGGMGMSTPMPATAGTSGLAGAMSQFIASPQNLSGVVAATMQPLMDQLNGSNGQMMGSGTGSVVNGTMSGKVFNGAMSRATVTAYALHNGTRGAQIASAAANAQGAFTMSLGSYAGPVMMQVNNGTYTDSATGNSMTMGSADVMTAVMTTIANGANVTGVWITPISSMAQMRAQSMSGGMTDANISAANAAVGNYFMMGDILVTACMDPAVTGSGSAATQDQRNCGTAIAAMSQYAMDLGMTSSMGFVTSMMNDASDGMMNGRMGSNQISMGGGMMGSGGMMQSNAGTSGLAMAMTDFMGSTMNHSGLTAADMNMLIQKLSSSNGQL